MQGFVRLEPGTTLVVSWMYRAQSVARLWFVLTGKGWLPRYSTRADMWSAAATLFELADGRVLFAAPQRTPEWSNYIGSLMIWTLPSINIYICCHEDCSIDLDRAFSCFCRCGCPCESNTYSIPQFDEYNFCTTA